VLRKGHILTILVIAISFVTVPAFAGGFYSNEIYDFSFEAPTDWKFIENMVTVNGEPIQVAIFPSEFNPLLNTDSPQILIIFENLGQSKVSTMNDKTVANYYLEKFRNEIPGGKLISSEVDSKSWGWIFTQKFSFPMNFGLGSTTQFITEQKSFVFKDRESYIVAYFATQENYQRYYPVYENVLDTLVIKGVAVPEFQEIAMMILASSIVLVIVFARKFSKFQLSENS